jgi:hypothetical protein
MTPLPTHVRRRRLFIALVLAPWLLYALPALYVALESSTRFDPSYFTPQLVARYAQPDAAFDDWAKALRDGDEALYSQVRGRSWDESLTPRTELSFAPTQVEQVGSYWRFAKPGEFTAYFEQVNGRWVYAPNDWRFRLYTGAFLQDFLAAALFYYLMVGLMVLYRWMRARRQIKALTPSGTPR